MIALYVSIGCLVLGYAAFRALRRRRWQGIERGVLSKTEADQAACRWKAAGSFNLDLILDAYALAAPEPESSAEARAEKRGVDAS